MRILFIRHGHPNYALDCLTELGHAQAEMAAHRLLEEGIDDIYASSCGRAYETALHTADRISKDVEKLDFIREIGWNTTDGTELYEGGHPWKIADYVTTLGYSLMDESWTQIPPYSKSVVMEHVNKVAQGTDAWLETLGYRREGDAYRVIGDNTDRTVALFSHGGSSSAALAHILNLPFFYVCGTVHLGFTSITAIKFADENGALVIPRIEYLNDTRHIKTEDPVFGN